MRAGTDDRWAFWRQRAGAYARLMRWHRPIGALLLLWPMLWALWLAARGLPDLHVLIVMLLGVWFMRSAGCVINDFADRDVDPHVSRTRDRPLATGEVQPREALVLFALLCLVAAALVLTLNRLTILLSFAALALAAVYPFMKRYTYLPQVWLGAAFGWAVPMAFAAQTGQVPALGWLIFLLAVIWALIYDTEYAMVDRPDDLRAGVKSTAILFGAQDRAIIGGLQAFMLLGLVLLGRRAGLDEAYYGMLMLAAVSFLWQQWLIRDREADGCFRAFMNNNLFGGLVFLGIVLGLH